MDRYGERRIVSWICHYLRKGWTKEQIQAQAQKRRPPFAVADIDAAWTIAQQACRNADMIGECMRRIKAGRKADATPAQKAEAERLCKMRLCDLPGCKFPKE
jgi:hypothetical protein